MKKLFAALALFLMSFGAMASVYDFKLSLFFQKPFDENYQYVQFPDNNTNCLLLFVGNTPPTGACATLGAGLSVNGSGELIVSGIPPATTLTTTGTGAATYNSTTGALNIPTPSSPSSFNFSAPAAKTIAISTAYQAADTTKAALITISPSCTNATTVIAASACTMQIRQSASSGLTCSNGTVVSAWSSTIALGLVITQGNSFPVDVKLPAAGYFIVCPSAGTFTLSAVEQSAG